MVSRGCSERVKGAGGPAATVCSVLYSSFSNATSSLSTLMRSSEEEREGEEVHRDLAVPQLPQLQRGPC